MKKGLNRENIVVALDIGTTKICVLVAQKISEDNLEIVGIGRVPSLGLAKGVIVDIAQAVHTIKLAIKEAELMVGFKVENVGIGISGSHIQSLNSHGMIPIKKDWIRSEDISTVLTAARAIVIPEGQQILHILPQYFVIDGQQKIADPVGMFGVRLEAKVHIITASVTSVQNMIRCCQLSGVTVSDIVLEHLASADAVLSEDEKTLGVGILDIGGGTSDFAIYKQGTIRHTKVIPIAGNHITNDIAMCLRTTVKDAERIKCQFGRAFRPAESAENNKNNAKNSKNNIEELKSSFEVELIQGKASKSVSIDSLVSIVEPRVIELFLMLKKEIISQGLDHLMPAGLVLTGGGSLLKDIQKVAQSILKMPVRVGKPNVPDVIKESLESPVYSTGYGLLLHILKKNKKNFMNHLTGPLISRIFWRMKSWVTDFF